MKSRLTLVGLLGLLLGACSTGGYVTGTYSDDIYFTPGDVPPPVRVEEPVSAEPTEKSANSLIISNIERNDDGSNTMNNYIFDGTEKDADVLRYNMDQMDLQDSDTTVYYNDDEMKYVINNYYDGDDLDYAYRIRRFHNPYFYDPFYWDNWSYYDPFYYDPWYYGSSWSLSWNWGWGYPYYGSYYGWGYPYSGWGYPYYSWGYPYYGSYYGSYYGWNHGYWGGGYYSNYADGDHYRYGRRTTTGGGSVGRSVQARGTDSPLSAGRTVTKSSSTENRRPTGITNTRVGDKSASTNSRVLTEKRRPTSSGSITRQATNGNNVRGNSNTNASRTQSYTRPGTSTQNRNYTRPVTTKTQNNYSRPRVVTNSQIRSGATYTSPRSTTTYNRTYRANSTYNRSSSRGVSSRSYSAPSSLKSSGTYRAPSRSSAVRSSSSFSRGSSGVSRSSGGGGSVSSGGGSRSSGGGGGSRSSGGGGRR